MSNADTSSTDARSSCAGNGGTATSVISSGMGNAGTANLRSAYMNDVGTSSAGTGKQMV